jgi:uncharacterized membrane protein
MTKLHQFLYNYRNSISAWLVIVLLAVLGLHYGVDSTLLSLVILLVGILGQAFGALLAWIGLIPVVGPLIAKVLALPFFWILNGVGYFASIIAIQRGFTREVVNYRILTVILLIGITIGYVLGKLI